jgi:hypothetical protein
MLQNLKQHIGIYETEDNILITVITAPKQKVKKKKVG